MTARTMLILFLILSLPLAGQAATEPSPVKPTIGDRVRVESMNDSGRWTTGTLVGVQDSLVTLAHADTLKGTSSFPVADIKRFQVHTGRHGHTGKGALVGLLTGFLITVVANAADNGSSGFGPDSSDGIIVAFTMGAPLVLGALIGTAIRTDKWEDADGLALSLGPAPGFGGLALTLSW